MEFDIKNYAAALNSLLFSPPYEYEQEYKFHNLNVIN